MKNIKIWLILTKNSFQQILTHRIAVMIFTLGKLIRISLFVLFLAFLFKGTKGIGEYSRDQIIFFYLSFSLIDTLAQTFFREVYRFRQLIITGNFDHVLVKPMSPLIRVLLGGADLSDLIVLLILTIVILWFGISFISSNIIAWLLFIIFIVNGLMIAAALHIFVLGIGVLTTSVDHIIMVYRDFSSTLRIPVDLYAQPLRFILTFLIPLGIMITVPPKILMGLVSPYFIVIYLLFGLIFLLISLKFWKFCLKQYSSASS